MKINLEEARIYVRPGATDLRKGVSGLCSIIGNEMNLDALCGSAFLFCNKTQAAEGDFLGQDRLLACTEAP